MHIIKVYYVSQSTHMAFWLDQSAARTFTLVLTQRVKTWSAHAESASLHLISEIWLLLQCPVALQHGLYEADALEQRRPCTRTSATTSNFYSHILNSHSRALEKQHNICLNWKRCDSLLLAEQIYAQRKRERGVCALGQKDLALQYQRVSGTK